jgi:DNA (cytosine-5)-methyltransferase 1
VKSESHPWLVKLLEIAIAKNYNKLSLSYWWYYTFGVLMEFKLGELFCGPGGLALGAHSAIIKNKSVQFKIIPTWANDYDPDTCETYRNNICKDTSSQVICKDIRKLDIATLSDIDALAFGFPCNDYSVVGEQKGMDGVFGPLYSYGVKILKKFKPKWFLAENVGGLKNANEGKAFKQILNELFSAGYNVIPHLYKFEMYGVPQARHRLIIVGTHKDLDVIYRVPAATTLVPKTCLEAIENPPIPKTAFNNELTKQSDAVVQRLRYIKPGENAFTANLPEHLRLNVSGATISQIYKRLDPTKPAYTVTGSGGGGTHVYHWKENRALTNRERARLQTFPDNFVFHGSKESVRKQIGMAVPPAGAKIIFEAILKTFAGVDYKYCEPSISPLLHANTKAIQIYNESADQLRLLEERKKYG